MAKQPSQYSKEKKNQWHIREWQGRQQTKMKVQKIGSKHCENILKIRIRHHNTNQIR